jgi:hypothetical protein
VFRAPESSTGHGPGTAAHRRSPEDNKNVLAGGIKSRHSSAGLTEIWQRFVANPGETGFGISHSEEAYTVRPRVGSTHTDAP